jgi:hypothetical protein
MAISKTRMLAAKENVSKLYRGNKRNIAAKVVQDYDIFEMAREGYNAIEISNALAKRGVTLSPAAVNKRIQNVLFNIHENSITNIEEVRKVELSKLDRREAKLNAMLAQRNVKVGMKLQIIRELGSVAEARHKLLGIQSQKVEQKTELTVRIYKGLEGEDAPETPQIQTHYPMLPTPEQTDSRPGPVLIGQKLA